jgi:hypothetical protein
MKRNCFLFLLLLFLLYACKNNSDRNISENNIDAARNFIRAALDGKFREARDFMLNDSINTNYMDVAERAYERADQATKDGYKSSSIRIYSPVTEVNDSTTIIIFSNSFKNDHDTLRVVKLNNRWLVDLKYLYLHDTDSLYGKKINTDSIP